MLFIHLGRTFPIRLAEWFLSSMLLTWGLILVGPTNSFDLAVFYVYLSHIADEQTWGILATSVGVMRLVALIINGYLVPPTFYLRSGCSFLSCFFWFGISVGLLMSNVATPALAVYPWLLVMELATLYRTAREHTESWVQNRALSGELNGGTDHTGD